MTVQCLPLVTVGGVPVGLGPGGPVDQLVAVDEVSVKWGRSDLLSQPTPATASLTVRDTAPGGPFAARRDLVGRGMTIGWGDGAGAAGALFHGRITDPEIRPRKLGGYYVELPASSREVDAGNVTIPAGTVWPAESLGDRRDRIVAALGGTGGMFAGPLLWPSRFDVGLLDVADPGRDFEDYTAATAEVGGKSALELLRQLYSSVYPLPLVYDPARDGFGFVVRPRYAYAPATGTTRAGWLAYDPVTARHVIRPAATDGGALALSAGELAHTASLVRPMEAAITRISVAYTEAGAAGAAESVTGSDELALGVRALKIESALGEREAAQQLANAWARFAAGEAAAPRLAPVTYRTARTPFPDLATAAALLRCVEGGVQLFVRGAWSTPLGVRPLFTVIGGTVSYAGGEWSVQMTLAPIAVEGGTSPLTARYAASSTAVRLRDVDPAVTLADLAFTEVGAGYTPTNQPFTGS